MSELTTCAIVDDHEVVRSGMRDRLAQVAWLDLIGEAATAAEALALLDRHRPTLVLMDVRLPDGDGLDVARRAREAGIESRVVLYSGNATTAQAEQALESGVAGFVLKDSPMSMVVEALASARDGRPFLDPMVAADLMSSPTSRGLSPRELQILKLVADGGQNAAIAFELGISAETVKAHVSNILVKLDADGRTHAVATALREGIID